MAYPATPITIQSATLVVNDLHGMSGFYQNVIGLKLLESNAQTQTLGAGNCPLLTLEKDAQARRYPTEAGLFHIAFLMPDRASLGRWLRHVIKQKVELTGATDHSVSEAVYLNDPEGNGIEVYADRPADTWSFRDDRQVIMRSTRLDTGALQVAGLGTWRGAPHDMVIGHIHLQVGSIDLLHQFMTRTLKQSLMLSEAGAGFYATGGYHHHFSGNIWNTKGASTRSPDSTGLALITLLTDGTLLKPQIVSDPWGTKFAVKTGSSHYKSKK